MDYEKKYKEALAWISSLHPTMEGAVRENAERYFPEIKESEDERIKKDLYAFLDDVWHLGKDADFDKWGKADCSDWMEWVEKQGEQKPITDFSNLRTWKYIVDAVLTEKEGVGQYLDSPFTEELSKKLQKRFGNIEQMPIEWSEEDDAMFQGVIETEQYMLDVVYGRKIFAVGHEDIKEECTKELAWLKSLRPQKLWKSAWSEKDEKLLKLSLENLTELKNRFDEEYGKVGDCINWLKSLKDRIK